MIICHEMPLNGPHVQTSQGNLFLVAVRRPIRDTNCLTVHCFCFRRIPIFEFRASHLSGVGLTSPCFSLHYEVVDLLRY